MTLPRSPHEEALLEHLVFSVSMLPSPREAIKTGLDDRPYASYLFFLDQPFVLVSIIQLTSYILFVLGLF